MSNNDFKLEFMQFSQKQTKKKHKNLVSKNIIKKLENDNNNILNKNL